MRCKPLSVVPTKRETVFGLILLLLYFFIFPLLAAPLAALLCRGEPSVTAVNVCYDALNLAGVLPVFHGFLRENLRAFRADDLPAVLLAFLLCRILAVLTSAVTLALLPDFQNRNDGVVASMASVSPLTALLLCTVAAPIVEETLFRGLIFGALHGRNRALAYFLSMLCFSAVHITGYLSELTAAELLVSLLAYAPAAAVLCALYENRGSLLPSVLLHALLNLSSFAALYARQ